MTISTTGRAKIAVGTLFVVLSTAGAALIFSYWSSVSFSIASGRAILFVIIVACVSLAGYLLYEKQCDPKSTEAIPEQVDSEFSPPYWPALRFGIVVQAILGMFTVLLLDGGRLFEIFGVAFLGHWLGILFSMMRRRMSLTKTDLIFIRWGTPLLMLTVGAVAPLIWMIIGESELSGWQRLWSGWTRR